MFKIKASQGKNGYLDENLNKKVFIGDICKTNGVFSVRAPQK